MKQVLLTTANQIEIHYFLKNESHSMDAKILHDCNGEILHIIKIISDLLEISYQVEAVGLSEGGLRQVLKFTDKNSARLTLLVAVITLLFTIFPPQRKLSDLEERNLELQNQKLELEINQLHEKSEGDVLEENSIETINESPEIVESRSHFYERITNYEKVEKIAYTIMDNNKIIDTKVIDKDLFPLFIKEVEKSPEVIDEYAQIILIAPILIDKKYKWKGLYHEKEIDFFMNDSKFRDEIEHRNVTFQAGTVLKCKLITRRKIDESGIVKVTSYGVENVFEVLSLSESFLTISGKIKQSREREERAQQKFDFDGE